MNIGVDASRAGIAAVAAATLLTLGGCVTVPTGPAVTVLPGQYKPYDLFRFDDAECRQVASSAIGGSTQAATDAAAASAVTGSALGAAVGAIIGSATGQAGQGAAVGAGMGLLFGSAAGSNVAYGSSIQLQQRYDGAYMQCMYAKGNQIPMRTSNRVVYQNAPGYQSPPVYQNPPGYRTPPGYQNFPGYQNYPGATGGPPPPASVPPPTTQPQR